MDNPFSNIDSAFKNAFEHWEAPHSPAEMNAGWQQVANNLPQAPGAHTPSPGNTAGHFAGSIGKIIGFSGLGAAVVTTAAVLYNIYVRPLDEKTKSVNNTEQIKPVPGPAVAQNSNPVSTQANPGKTIAVPFNNLKSEHASGGQTEGNHSKPFAANPFINATPSGTAIPQNQNPVRNNTAGPVIPKQQDHTAQAPEMKLFLSDSIVCMGVEISSSSNVSMPGVIIEWGDGSWDYFNGKNVHTYTRSGNFKAHLTIDSTTAYRSITVLQSAKARFIVHQVENLNFSFENKSLYGKSYDWDFGDGSPTEAGYYPNHIYTDTGIYKARLVAYNSTGCTDTTYQTINAQRFSEPRLDGNVITPNGDGKDDDVGVTVDGETSFQFEIMDRTGQIVFQTTDKNKRWNGQNQRTGQECKAGTYYYTITYILKQNTAPKNKNGTITLIRPQN